MTTVFIISAPSGSGKSTLVTRLLTPRCPVSLFDLLHHPEAARARGERRELLLFRTARSSKRCMLRGEFLEHAEVFGNYYGTHRSVLEHARAERQGPGARHRRPRCETIEEEDSGRRYHFYPCAFPGNSGAAPASPRLRIRKRVIQRRLQEAAEEIRNYDLYDYVLINREVDAVRRIRWARS